MKSTLPNPDLQFSSIWETLLVQSESKRKWLSYYLVTLERRRYFLRERSCNIGNFHRATQLCECHFFLQLRLYMQSESIMTCSIAVQPCQFHWRYSDVSCTKIRVKFRLVSKWKISLTILAFSILLKRSSGIWMWNIWKFVDWSIKHVITYWTIHCSGWVNLLVSHWTIRKTGSKLLNQSRMQRRKWRSFHICNGIWKKMHV